MKDINYAGLAIPAFFIFLGIEYLAAARNSKQSYFKFESSVSSITVGIAERLMSLFLSVSFYQVFQYIYDHFAIFEIPNTWYVWVLLIMATDLVWYWYHRFGHEVNLLWAAHVVHHQSEEFNYTVSARITVFQSLARNAFWCVLPLLGFHPAMVVTMLVVHGSYSFFTHTRLVGRLGWLEYVLITPSHHRIHHASNEKYLNKNYGDIFIFWDKLFGTFKKEDEEPVYGLTHPLRSHSFVWQHLHYFVELYEAARRRRGIVEKLKVVLGRPEQLDNTIRADVERKFVSRKKRPLMQAGISFRFYLIAQIAAASSALLVLVLFVKWFDLSEKVLISSSILITLVNCGALIEQRRWIFYLEYIRLLVLAGLASYEAGAPQFFTVALVFVYIAVMSPALHRWYWKFIYRGSITGRAVMATAVH